MQETQTWVRWECREAERAMHQKEEISTRMHRHKCMEMWGEREGGKERRRGMAWQIPSHTSGAGSQATSPIREPSSTPDFPLPLPSSAERHPQHRLQGLRCPDSPGAAAPAQLQRRPRCPHGGGAGCGGLEGAAGARRTSRRPVGRRAGVSTGGLALHQGEGGRWMGWSGGYLEQVGRSLWGRWLERGHICLPGPMES